MKRFCSSLLALCLVSPAAAAQQQRPNILWIYIEDLSPWIASYGDALNAGQTPRLDALAKRGVRFARCYVTAPVCSACRSAIITGVMQTTTGTHEHRSSRTAETRIELPAGIKPIPQILRAHGYFTFNRGKDDYNFAYERSDLYAGPRRRTTWKQRPEGKPFFGQIQLAGGKARTKKLANKLDPAKVTLPPYMPDTPVFRKWWAHHYDCVRLTDTQVGKILDELEADGLTDNTVVFVFSDHGNNHSLRHKQFCYEGGVHVPLYVAGPADRLNPGSTRNDLVSSLDISATTLALAGVTLPDYLDGRDLFAADHKPRDYVISARDRCDYTIDRIRTVRSDRFRYIRNFLTDRPLLQPQYRDPREYTKLLRAMHARGELDACQEATFFGKRPAEELYDLAKDPDEVHNLAADPKFAAELARHRKILDDWIARTGDKGQFPESAAGMRAVLKRWGKRCVNPEYDAYRQHGEPPVQAPFKRLDTAAVNRWWETSAAVAKAGKKNRQFMDLRVPREAVVAFALYTVQNATLKLSAQLYPLYPNETRTVRLELERAGEWREVAKAHVFDLGWSALFRIEGWDARKDVRYRVRHGKNAMFEGLIRHDPVEKDVISVALLSCNSKRDRGDRAHFVHNIKHQDPDLLFFAGDQSYDHREHTAAWLLFGRQFREILRDRPVITIPDDHDVGQPNLWGQGGRKAPGGVDSAGGYMYHPAYVKLVERCQTAHLPDPYDPRPVEQGIGVYFTSLNVGGVDFAIVEDRKFKTGPKGHFPKFGPRPDHVRDPDFDTTTLDKPGLVLLGERQLRFLEAWGQNWKGAQIKAVLSQSPFCNAAHLHGGRKNRLVADLDSNGWPQTGRNKAVRALRKAFAVHLAGDQHIATLLRHGVGEWRDAGWSFTGPAIVNTIYSRWWWPKGDAAGAHRDPHDVLPFTGDYLDGFRNRITMAAYANPDADKQGHGAGYGVVRFDKKQRTITFECWPRFADASKPDAKQFPGWPRTIEQTDNFAPPSWGTLPELVFDMADPVVQLVDERDRSVIYTLRIRGKRFRARAPLGRSITVKAGNDAATRTVRTGLRASR